MESLEGLSLCGLHVDELAATFAFGEDNNTINESEDSVILTHTHVETGMMSSATLTLDDIACFAALTTENLYTESFAF